MNSVNQIKNNFFDSNWVTFVSKNCDSHPFLGQRLDIIGQHCVPDSGHTAFKTHSTDNYVDYFYLELDLPNYT